MYFVLKCGACKGKFFRDKQTGEMFFKPVVLGEIVSDSFLVKPLKCNNCKTRNVFIHNIDIEYKPKELEHIVILSTPML